MTDYGQEMIATASTVGPRATVSAKTVLHLQLTLDSTGFVTAWLGINALHLVCAVYLTQLARVLWFAQNPILGYWTTIAMGNQHVYLPHASGVVGLVAALHWWRLLCTLWSTLQKRKLAFSVSSTIVKTLSACVVAIHSSRRSPSTRVLSRLKPLTLLPRVLARIWVLLFSRRGVFGVESRFFHTVFTLRELVEIVAQTIQAYRSSVLLPRRWLCNLLVALIVINCWSTPVLQHMFRHQEVNARFACLLIDVLLNMGSSVLIPFVIFWPYYEAIDHTSLQFTSETLFDELWFTRLTMELQLLFSLTLLDMFSKLVPHIAIYSSLTDITTLIRRTGPRPGQSRVLALSAPDSVKRNAPVAWASDEQHKHLNNSATKCAAVVVRARHARCLRFKHATVCAVFFAWGLVVLALHLRGVARTNVPVLGCRQAATAWFATAYPCAVYAYNCYRHNTSSPADDSLLHLDTETLMSLRIAHCPSLIMPHAIQRFPHLIGLDLYNNTLVEWTEANRISDSRHTQLIAIVIVRTNMTHLPDGLLGPLPPSLIDIELSHTNLTTLPSDLQDRWHPLGTLFVEHSLLTAFPPQLFALCYGDLSLHGNRIEAMPMIPANAYYSKLTLANNPLSEMPHAIGSGALIESISLENTLVEELPAWISTHVIGPVFLHGSSYCKATHTSDATQPWCTTRDNRSDGNVPIDYIDAQTQP